jgi:predicted DCC family thiol-disulfide oxidoreductase YuxK
MQRDIVEPKKNIIFFDGLCNLCNQWVDFVLKLSQNQFYFAPLQGETAKKLLDPALYMGSGGEEGPKSIVFIDQEGLYIQSAAVLKIFSKLSSPSWKVLSKVGSLIPGRMRDSIYDHVASRRYAWFGKRETCRLPTEQERSRFLK